MHIIFLTQLLKIEDYKETLRNIEFLNLALNYCIEVNAGTNCFYIENTPQSQKHQIWNSYLALLLKEGAKDLS